MEGSESAGETARCGHWSCQPVRRLPTYHHLAMTGDGAVCLWKGHPWTLPVHGIFFFLTLSEEKEGGVL